LIPKANSSSAPTVTKEPSKLTDVLKNTNQPISNSTFDKKPVEPLKGVIVGGVPSGKKDELPSLKVSGTSKRQVEIQVVEDVPVLLVISNLKPRSLVSVSLISSKGKEVALGQYRTDADGLLELPPITISDSDRSVLVRIRDNSGLNRTVTLRG
jgi:hypothetical protein